MDEQFYDYNDSYETSEIPPYTPPTPKKREKKNHVGLRICALALVFALLGGALGAGGVMWYESSRGQTGTASKNETAMLQGIRENSVLNTVTVDSGKEMTAAEVYAANVNSTVASPPPSPPTTGASRPPPPRRVPASSSPRTAIS